jgi:hypothetical protein
VLGLSSGPGPDELASNATFSSDFLSESNLNLKRVTQADCCAYRDCSTCRLVTVEQ